MYDIYTSNIRQYLDMWLEMINAENKNIYIVVLCNKIDGLKERNTDHGLKNAIQKGERIVTKNTYLFSHVVSRITKTQMML